MVYLVEDESGMSVMLGVSSETQISSSYLVLLTLYVENWIWRLEREVRRSEILVSCVEMYMYSSHAVRV